MNTSSVQSRQPLLESLAMETVGIYGCGRTGQSLIHALSPVVRDLVVFDDGLDEPPSELQDQYPSIEWVLGTTTHEPGVDRYIVSPGVPWSHPVMETARERGVPVWAELELAYRLCEGQVWAVTGTNGKSTCVELCGSLLRARENDRSVVTCGNLGPPFIDAVHRAEDPGHTDFVVEVSTFQIEGMVSFQPHATLLTNLGDDHRNRHESLQHYHDLKWELVQRTDERGVLALYREDPEIRRRSKTLPDKTIRWFDRNVVRDLEWQFDGGGLHCGGATLTPGEIAGCLRLFPENVLGSLALVGEGMTPGQVHRGLAEFQPLRFRAEECSVPGSVRVINDSKATNPHAVLQLVQRLDGPLRLVLGGKGKNTDFTPLFDYLTECSVEELILAGTDSSVEQLESLAHSRQLPYRREPQWEHAVKGAVRRACPGETVLLSPGGSSFDAFENYRHRGESFSKWVEQVIGT